MFFRSIFVSTRPKLHIGLLLAGLAVLLNGAMGCRTQTADASDPDPHYYKGADFHGKHKKA